MLQYFFRKKHSKNTLTVIQGAFPSCLHEEVRKVLDEIKPAKLEPHTEASYCFNTKDEQVTIPSRVYFPEISPSQTDHLTQIQVPILAAIMTRHHSGYHRETWIHRLLAFPNPWTTPFVAVLLGDYVREILSTIHKELNPVWEPLFHDFAQKNPKWLRPLSHRILSYWDIYYRRSFPRLTDYPGYLLAEKLGLWDKKVAPRLMKKLTKPQ
jgi:hypothetical protein